MSTYKQHMALLRNRSYPWFIVSSALASMGNGLAYVALTWLVIRVHSSVSAVAVLMICFWLPMVILGPLCGVISDRFHRLSLMILATGARAVLFILLGIYLNYHYSLTLIYTFCAVNGTFFSLYNPAVFTFVREVVSKEDLLIANTQLDITYEVGNVVGMGLAGFVMALLSPTMALVLNGILFIVATFLLAFVRYQPQAKAMDELRSFTGIWGDFKAGLRYISGSKVLYILYILQLLVFVEFMTAPILLAPYAKDILHTSAGQFGQIEAAMSVGIVTGGMFNPPLASRFGAFKVLLVEMVISGLGFLAFSFTQHFTSAIILYFILGLSLSSWPLIVTKAQHITDISYQGRVQGAFSSISGIAILIIYVLVNLFGDKVPIGELYLLELIFAIAAGLLLWRYGKLIK